jgi:hypothetical protein
MDTLNTGATAGLPASFAKGSVNDMTTLSEWGNFYSIVGSSAGALIGLQFVVMTLVANMPITRGDAHAGHAFTTPTVVHFAVVLLLSAVGSAPWNQLIALRIAWALLGLVGAIYVIHNARRLRSQGTYKVVFEDWLFHVLLPFTGYVALAVTAWAAPSHPRTALFGVGAISLLLLFVGIHNAWDLVTYHVFVRQPDERGKKEV